MAWTTLSYPFGSVLTSSKMTQLYDNFAAVTNKDSGAPVLKNDYIVNAMIATNAVNADSIADGTVGSNEIATDAVKTSELATGSANGSQAMAANTTYVLSAGWYLIGGTGSSGTVQVNTSAGWKNVSPAGEGALVFSDGTNTRINNVGVVTPTIYWRKFS